MKYLILLLLISCSAQRIKNNAPERPHDRRYYRFADEQFTLFNRDCKWIKEPLNKNCIILEKDLKDKDIWNWFKSRDFIIIPYDFIF